jgi:hypothetical protein
LRAKDYTFVEEKVTTEKDRQGRVTKTESITFDVLMIGDRPFRKKIAQDGKSLPEKEARKVEAEFEKALKKHEARQASGRPDSGGDRARDESRALFNEIPDAFLFTLLGEDAVDGQPAWVIHATPKPGYRGKARRADLLAKFRGKLWIDKRELQWVRVEAETIAPVSFGWFLARLERGARLTFEQARVNSEVWLPTRSSAHLDARLGFKRINNDVEVRWRDYRKFRTDSRVLPAGEIPPAR